MNRLLSDGPFFMIFRSSGEKNTTLAMPNSSLALRMGTPLMAMPFRLVLFQMHVNAVRDIVLSYLQFNMGFILIEPDDIPVLGAFM